MVLVPAVMIGSSLGLVAFWVFSLRLPEANDVGLRRKYLSKGHKIALAYANWVGTEVLKILPATLAKRLQDSADRLALLADRPGLVSGVEVVGYTVAIPILTAACLTAYWSVIAPGLVVPFLIIGVPLAACAPLLYLWDARNIRLRRLRNSFPNALDLLTLTVEAGMDFTEGMKLLANRTVGMALNVARKRHDYHICKLFGELLSDVQMGMPRNQALRKLEEKTGLPEIGSFATVLALSDETGGNISVNLRQLAAEMRNTRLMRAEEFIAKAPVKMLFPIALFLFPVVFVVIFGPIAVQLARNLRF